MTIRDDGGSRGRKNRRSWPGAKLKRAAHMQAMVVIMLLVFFGASTLSHLHSGFHHTKLEEVIKKNYTKAGLEERLGKEVFNCDRSQFRTDVCNIRGDIRLNSINHSFVLYAVDSSTSLGEERVKPYTRKWEMSCMDTIHEVTLQSVPATLTGEAIVCDVQHHVPGAVFSTGGYTGNLYHEFNDGLIPLFITTQHLKGEVVFVISELHDWWLAKYKNVLQELTNYPLINFERESWVHCFPELTVGLHIHGEQSIDPMLMPDNKSIWDFQALLRHAYRPSPEEQKKKQLNTSPAKVMPQLTILIRQGTRVLLNIRKIVEVAQKVGFQVKLLKPSRSTELKRLYWMLDKSDVLMGVHGAALTHLLFMRPGSVFIQIIPLGTDWAAFTYYGEPATKLGLQYLPYKIEAAESSLSRKYNSTDPILINPASIVEKGWWEMKKIYLEAQDVQPSLVRMRKLFQKAKSLIQPKKL